jgi:hypothetical protein
MRDDIEFRDLLQKDELRNPMDQIGAGTAGRVSIALRRMKRYGQASRKLSGRLALTRGAAS